MTTPQSKHPETDALESQHEIIFHNAQRGTPWREMLDKARTLEQQRNEALAKLQIDQWIKGQWKCPTCNFVLSKNVLSMRDGNIFANAEPFNKICPNDGAAMKPLTYKESYNDICKCCEQQVESAVKAEKERDSLKEQLKSVNNQILMDTECIERIRNRAYELEATNLEQGKNVMVFDKKFAALQEENQSYISQMAVMVEALKRCWDECECGYIYGGGDGIIECGSCRGKSQVNKPETLIHDADCFQNMLDATLGNPPLAAKELLERVERMEKCLSMLLDTPYHSVIREALSTTTKPTE